MDDLVLNIKQKSLISNNLFVIKLNVDYELTTYSDE